MSKRSGGDSTDYYAVLGLEATATEKEIRSAYRRTALKYHPDKNPGNAAAAAKFTQLTGAYEILGDVAAKAKYDQLLKARKAKNLRDAELNHKRKKLKSDLERREEVARLARLGVVEEEQDEEAQERALEREVERLRKDGFMRIQMELLRKQMAETEARKNTEQGRGTAEEAEGGSMTTVKLKWSSKKTPAYTEDMIRRLMLTYGPLGECLVREKSAVVEFAHLEDARRCVLRETGAPSNPITVTLLVEGAKAPQARPSVTVSRGADATAAGAASAVSGGRDHESLTLMRMRQAAERKRLIAEAQKEDV